MTDYRHEWKIELSPSDLLILRQRLRRVLQPDTHAVDGRYLIRSLYFDTPEDRALREKLDGVSRREKFRIRYYNGDVSCIHLEKKSKIAGLGRKDMAVLQPWQAQAIVDAAVNDANNIRQSSIQYTDDMLRSLQTIINHTMEGAKGRFDSFMSSMQSSYDIVSSNRNELAGGLVQPQEGQEQGQEPVPQEQGEN